MPLRFRLHGVWLSGPTAKIGLALALLVEAFDYVGFNLHSGEHA